MKPMGWTAIAILVAACGNKNGTSAPASGTASASASASGSAEASGSAPASGSAQRPSAGPDAAPAAAAGLDPKALDRALAAKGVDAKDVMQRAMGTHSAWAVVIGKKNEMGDALEYDIVRVRADGAAWLALTPPASPQSPRPPWFSKDVTSFEARDVDGDGTDDGVLVLEWLRDVEDAHPKHCKGCNLVTGEDVQQLWLLRGAGPVLESAFTQVVSYKTDSQMATGSGEGDAPAPEVVVYQWKIENGDEPVVHLERTDDTVNKARIKGLLDPDSDLAGTGDDFPVHLKP